MYVVVQNSLIKCAFYSHTKHIEENKQFEMVLKLSKEFTGRAAH